MALDDATGSGNGTQVGRVVVAGEEFSRTVVPVLLMAPTDLKEGCPRRRVGKWLVAGIEKGEVGR